MSPQRGNLLLIRDFFPDEQLGRGQKADNEPHADTKQAGCYLHESGTGVGDFSHPGRDKGEG